MPVGHHFVESSVLQDASPPGPATFLGFLLVLVDDWSIHWRASNPYGRGLSKVVDALEVTPKSLTMLGSFPSSSKSGAVCSNARVERGLRPFLRPFKMKVKRHMRDLGHEQSGPHARRLVERERMAAGIRRLPRLRRFRKVVGKKKLQRSYRRDSRHLGVMVRPRWVCCRARSGPRGRLRLSYSV